MVHLVEWITILVVFCTLCNVCFNQSRNQPSRLFRRNAGSDEANTERKETEGKKDGSVMEAATTTFAPLINKQKTVSEPDYPRSQLNSVINTNTFVYMNDRLPNVKSEADTDEGLAAWVFIVIGVVALAVIVISFTTALVFYRRKLAVRQNLRSTIPTISESAGLMYEPQSSKSSDKGRERSRYETQSSKSSDKGTERSRSTVSTYLSKDSQEEYHELMPLRSTRALERSSVIEMFDDIESEHYGKPVRRIEYDIPSPSYERELGRTNPRSVLSHPRHDISLTFHDKRSDREQSNREQVSPTRQQKDNRLPGGNIGFLRRSVDYIHNDIDLPRHMHRSSRSCEQDLQRRQSGHRISAASSPSQEEDSEFNMYRPAWERNRNESKSSSSTRSYISIPPTSPSENYVEAGSEDMFLLSGRSMPLVKMAWLTKNLEGDAKNEFQNYQTTSGTQTDSDSNVKAPNRKTVFGTPWQFGGTFSSRGGVMQAADSDVCLVVVPNAVPKGEYVDIYGAVFTDTTQIRKKMNIPAKECLITPVVEYCAVPASPFRRPVCVQLPHALPEEFDIHLIKVYTFEVDEGGKVTLFNVPASGKANEGRDLGACWEKGPDGHSIHISAFHFSGYFCTQCETTSWPSICTMVFGSHVQITQSRREVRVILYIWDRRLTIKDYLERFRKQESDVDRQLLTDMQVPLLDSASSDSRLVMCMEVMGGDDDRQCWRHVLRPDDSRPLFKPLQMRKLSEIVHCCRQTDPIRVEWALENAPHQVPNAVFQCCIDIMHVHESTSDYVTAMKEGSDDLMRTFYVRDLKVMTNSPQEPKQSVEFPRVDLKRTLSKTMDIMQTERMCQEFGISIKDIGNFRKKYSTSEAFQLGLVEECLRRHGPEKFLNLLPKILERLHYTEVMAVLDDKKILVRNLTDFTGVSAEDAGAREENVPQTVNSLEGGHDSTRCKSPFRRSPSPVERDRPNSPLYRRRRSRESHRTGSDHVDSEKSEDECVHNKSELRSPMREEQSGEHKDWEERQPKSHGKQRHYSPPADYDQDEKPCNQNLLHDVKKYDEKNIQERQPLKKQTSSSSTGDSLLGSRSQPLGHNGSAQFSSISSLGTSMYAHVDPQEYLEAFSDELLDDSMRQTYKKELLVNKTLHGHNLTNEYAPYYNGRGENCLSSSGPYAIPPESGQGDLSSLSDPVPPYRQLADSQRSYEKLQPPDKDQTLKKELYGISTVV